MERLVGRLTYQLRAMQSTTINIPALTFVPFVVGAGLGIRALGRGLRGGAHPQNLCAQPAHWGCANFLLVGKVCMQEGEGGHTKFCFGKYTGAGPQEVGGTNNELS